jgi:hypothetical protein
VGTKRFRANFSDEMKIEYWSDWGGAGQRSLPARNSLFHNARWVYFRGNHPAAMRKWILNLHLYGGLICAPYLIIFGFSSLHFNHHFSFVNTDSKTIEWNAPLSIESGADAEAVGRSVRDSLGLIGWPVPWRSKRGVTGDWEIAIERPGKSYVIHTRSSEHQARVEERRKGVWQVINSLHALRDVPNSSYAFLWGIYTEVCTWFVFLAAVSGVYLWANSRRERRAGAITALAAGLTAIALMGFVFFRG